MKKLYFVLLAAQFSILSCNFTEDEIIEIPIREGIPEGIAVDKDGNIYLSNLHTRDIIKCDSDGSNCQVIETEYSGIMQGLGMVVHENKLYALGNDNEYESRISILQVIDLKSMELEEAYELRDTIPTFFNDLVIHQGIPYITNTMQHCIYTLENDQLVRYLTSEEISYPNGIASSEKENLLFIASDTGIRTFDMGTQEFINDPNDSTRGIDGLKYFEGLLFGVQNGFLDKKNHSILTLNVKNGGQRITKSSRRFQNHPLFNIPTTMALQDKQAYVLMNSQLEQFENGAILNLDQLTNTYVLRFDLEG